MEKYQTYPRSDDAAEIRIDLHKNFRSRHQVLDSVNGIFEKIMDTDLGKVAYDDAARLYPGAVFELGPEEKEFSSELLLLDLQEEEGEESEETARTTSRRRTVCQECPGYWGSDKSGAPFGQRGVPFLL